jgi:sorbitol/mannitol transport system permease protein
MTVEAGVPVGTEPRRRPAPKKLTQGELWKRRGPLLPALIFAIILTQLPFLFTLYYSFQSRNLLRPETGRFVGLENYGKVFTDDLFRNAVFNTVKLTASAVILSMVLGVALAALLWKTSIFNPVFGLLNWVLSPFGVETVDWVSRFPMPSIVMVLTWQWTPFMMLIVLAGLQSQSPEVLEAARVDGARPWQIFRRITLPHLRQFIELAVLLASIFIVQTFDAIFMITQGGPGQATTNLPYFIYQQAFRAFDVGESAAAGVIVVVATIIIATFALRVVSNLFEEEA